MTWVERRRITGRKAEYRGIQSKSDRLGNRVCAHVVFNYSARPAPFVEVWREDLQGNRFDVQVLEMPFVGPKQVRVDDLTMMVAGANVHLIVGAHEDIDEPERDAIEYETVFHNWYTPWPGQGMAGEPEGDTTYIPQEAEVEIDYARIQSMIDQALARFSLGMPAMMRQALLDVVRTEGILTEAMFAGGSGSHTVYQQLVNTSFTGAKGALDEMPFGDEEEPQT